MYLEIGHLAGEPHAPADDEVDHGRIDRLDLIRIVGRGRGWRGLVSRLGTVFSRERDWAARHRWSAAGRSSTKRGRTSANAG